MNSIINMKFILIGLFCILCGYTSYAQSKDWLIDGSSFVAEVNTTHNGKRLELTNGLVRRSFLLSPNVATIALDNLMTSQNELRAVRPEATLVINGKEYPVGGLTGQPVSNFLTEDFIENMELCDSAFILTDYKVGKCEARFSWKANTKWISNLYPWPASGKRITFTYRAPEKAIECKGLVVRVIYEMYDGAPILSKWIEVENKGLQSVTLNSFKSEILALVETAPKVHYGEPHEVRMMAQESGNYTKNYKKSPVQTDSPRDYIDRFTQLFVVTDYAMGGDMEAMKDNPAVRWVFDHPEYESTGIRYYGQYKPSRLEVTPLIGPGYEIAPGKSFESCSAFEMLRDATDQERRGLAECKFWRMMSPWTQENPIFMHVRESGEQEVKQAIDQCAEVGFEMVIMTFGSGFQIENHSATYLQKMKELSQYAARKGIAIGGYSLLASRGAKPEDAAISRHTGKPANTRAEGSRFGVSPCLASDWGNAYFDKLKNFFSTTGMNVFENDGSYPGDPCASTQHSGHKGYEDSQWQQWRKMSVFYRWCRANGIYLNVPDWYFLNGSNKTPMGYVETNWSLPRKYQEIIERQNIYDGTWQKTPSMGFMFVPLTQYHGGGEAATIEPLCEHLDHYQTRLQNLFGAGVQACYRGPRLYDTDQTKEIVKLWVGFYKKYRSILDSDVIHLRRPDGMDWDGLMHVNPKLKQKALISVYNPLDIKVEKEIRIPLYYTGLTDQALVKEQDSNGKLYKLNRDYSITVKITIPAKGYNWYVIE
ncbi:MAG: hypothetical protein ACK5HZ_10065 [Macellibacteroides fermentans]|uniref:hypothetical protein n=1 Tax=Macellibacteroides fermentans TaxID=879969 RepID=UPI003ACDA0E8